MPELQVRGWQCSPLCAIASRHSMMAWARDVASIAVRLGVSGVSGVSRRGPWPERAQTSKAKPIHGWPGHGPLKARQLHTESHRVTNLPASARSKARPALKCLQDFYRHEYWSERRIPVCICKFQNVRICTDHSSAPRPSMTKE